MTGIEYAVIGFAVFFAMMVILRIFFVKGKWGLEDFMIGLVVSIIFGVLWPLAIPVTLIAAGCYYLWRMFD